jgi:hypothetical protein
VEFWALPHKNPKTTALLTKGLQISVVKKSVYDACLRFLNTQRFRVRNDVLVEKINEIPIKTFERILTEKGSKDRYDKRMARVVKLTIKNYLG